LKGIDFKRRSPEVARRLIGATLLIDGVGGIIVEVEAYDREDPASHCFSGPTPRNAAMFGPPGHAYIYVSYGMHFCLNVVTEGEGIAAAVLLRALEPTVGLELMRRRRGPRIGDRDLARGPGRLCAALGLSLAENGADLCGDALWIAETSGFPADAPIVATPRIGISQAADWPWRFALVGSSWVSGRKGSRGDITNSAETPE